MGMDGGGLMKSVCVSGRGGGALLGKSEVTIGVSMGEPTEAL